MATRTPETVNGALRPAGGYPPHEGAYFDGSDFYFREQSDFFAASGSDLLAKPASRAVQTLYDGAGLSVSEEFFGLHWHNWPRADPSVIKTSNDGTMQIDDSGLLFKTVRSHDFPVRWHFIEPTKGNFVWDEMDSFVNTHYAAGRDIIITLGFVPDWATTAPGASDSVYTSVASNPPDNLSDWNDYCSAVATRYLGKVKYYEVWNEANGGARWFNGTVQDYVDLLINAHTTIKAIDATAKILAPALAGGWSESSRSWLNSVLGTSDGSGGTAADYVDIVTTHGYASLFYEESSIDMPAEIDTFNALLASHGLGSAEVWWDEIGITRPETVYEQPRDIANRMRRYLYTLAAKGVNRILWYDVDGQRFGIVRVARNAAEAVELWNTIRAELMSGDITRVNLLWDGRIAVVRGGVNYIY